MKTAILTALLVIAAAPAMAQTYFTTAPDPNTGSFIAIGPGLPTVFYNGDGHGNYVVQSPGTSGTTFITRNSDGSAVVNGVGQRPNLPVVPQQ